MLLSTRDVLLAAATRALMLQCAATRLFLPNGDEVQPQDHHALRDGSVLYVSCGEAWRPPSVKALPLELPTSTANSSTSLALVDDLRRQVQLLTRQLDAARLSSRSEMASGVGRGSVAAQAGAPLLPEVRVYQPPACNVELERQVSTSLHACDYGQSFGCHQTTTWLAPRKVWVSGGCRGMFRCGHGEALFPCGRDGLWQGMRNCTCPRRPRRPDLCPVGTGSPEAELLLWKQRGVPGVWEDRVWPVSRHGCSEKALESEDAKITPTECIVVHSRRLIFTLVWKTGTQTLTDFAECAFGRGVKIQKSYKAASACMSVPKDYTHVAVVRDPLERFVSGYSEFLQRVQWRQHYSVTYRGHKNSSENIWARVPMQFRAEWGMEASNETAMGRFLRFVNASRCNSEGAMAHVATQSWYLRDRPVDMIYRTTNLSSQLAAAFGAPHCVPKRKVNSRHHPPGSISESRYWQTLSSDAAVSRSLCEMYLQDIVCLHPTRAGLCAPTAFG